MEDRAIGVNISLLEKGHIRRVEKYLKQSKKFRSVSAFYQYLTDDFFKRKTGAKDFMLFMGYPMIFAGIMLYVAITTQNVNEVLLQHNIISDLFLYNQIYFVIGFAFIGIIVAGFVFIWSKAKEGK